MLKSHKEVIIIITEIKKKFYDILTTDLNYTVIDNPYDIDDNEIPFPFLMLTLNSMTRDRFKGNFIHQVKFKVDVFSNYDGEAEILDIENKIYDTIEKMYDLKYITYIQENHFRIIDDKSTGVNHKHGIINYTFLVTGAETIEEVEEDGNNEENPTD